MVKRRKVRLEAKVVQDIKVEDIEDFDTDKAVPTLAKKVMEQTKDSNDDILEGLDLEGVSEQEKEEIKRALIASKQDQVPVLARRDSPSRGTRESQDGQETIEIESINSSEDSDQDRITSVVDNKVKDTGQTEQDDDDDDETQPPTDLEEEELDLSCNTLQMEDDRAYSCTTDVDDAASEQGRPMPSPQAQPQMEDNLETSIESVSILEDDSGTREPTDVEQGSGGFSPRSASSPRSSESSRSQTAGCQGSPETHREPGQKMEYEEEIFEAVAQENSVESNKSKKVPVSMEPLQRHYRAVKCQARAGAQYYAVEGMTTEQCAKAIYQLFETYRRKLKEAQRKLPEKLPFGNPVKSGRPKLDSLDIRKRGRVPVLIDLSDDEEVEFGGNKEAIATGTKRKVTTGDDNENKRGRNVNRNCDSDEDFVPAELYSRKNSRDKQKNAPDISRATENPRRVGRPRKKPVNVLVEETQPPEEEEAGIYEQSATVDYVIPETQEIDNDDEWLSIKSQLGKDKFENPMKQAKLKGYSIPRKKDINEQCEKDKEENGTSDENITLSPKRNIPDHPNIATDSEKPVDDPKIAADTKPSTGKGRKRKKAAVTVVEDTQDMTEDMEDKDKVRTSGRKKRKCFRLSSDSEVESVPETQGLDDSPDVTVIEAECPPADVPNMDNDVQETPDDTESVQETGRYEVNTRAASKVSDSDDSPQSPVIKRSRISRKNKLPKSDISNSRDNISHDKDRDTGEVSRSNMTKEKPQTTRRGVTRLISRPESKDSNASDVSMCSSQVSNTMIDESGDLYSTQFDSTANRNSRRDVNQNLKINKDNKSVAETIDEVLSVDSDEDVMVVKEVKGNLKTYSRGKPTRGKVKKIHVSKEQGIEEYLTKIHSKIRSHTNIDIEEFDNSAHVLDEPSEFNKTGLDISGHSDINESYSHNQRSKEVPVTIHMNESPFSVKSKEPFVSLHNVDVRHCSPSISGNKTEIRADTPSYIRKRLQTYKPEQNAKLGQQEYQTDDQPIKRQDYISHDHEVEKQDELRPIRLQDFMSNDAHADIIIRDDRPRTRRPQHRKPTATVTRAGINIQEEELQPIINVRGAGGGPRVRGRQDRHLEEEEPVVKTTKMDEASVECPLCSVHFPVTVIEEHASNCDGTAPDQGAQPPRVVTAGSQPGGGVGVTVDLREESDENPLAEDELPIGAQVQDADVQDVIRGMKSSPGEEGELVQCCICDGHVRKGPAYDQHFSQCMLRSKQQQEQIDNKGYDGAFSPQRHEQPESRQTRGRVRHRPDGPDTPSPGRASHRGKGRRLQHGPSGTAAADRYITESSQKEEVASDSDSRTDTSSGEEGSSSGSSSSGDEDDNITLGSIARAGSSSLITGPWNSTQAGTQSDGSHTIPNWLKNSAQSPIKSFVPLSMQKDSEYFKNQFKYNEEKIAKKQLKRKRKESRSRKSGGRRKKRRKVKRKKK